MSLARTPECIDVQTAKITVEKLARGVQSFLGTTTLGQLIFYLSWHEGYHTGQTEALRQLAGKNDKVI